MHYYPEPPQIIDNENVVLMANYTISRRRFEDNRANGGETKARESRISLLGAHAFNLNGSLNSNLAPMVLTLATTLWEMYYF